MGKLIGGENGNLLVQKFGGTSVGGGKCIVSVCNTIKAYSNDGFDLVVVVSAISPVGKEKGTTNRLLMAVESAKTGNFSLSKKIIDQIRTTHTICIHESFDYERHSEIAETLTEEVNEMFDEILLYIQAISTLKEVTANALDLIMGAGERLSAKIITAVCQSKGLQVELIDVSNLYEGSSYFKDDEEFFSFTKKRLGQLVKQSLLNSPSKGSVAVVPGFFGVVPGGMLEKIGRGYSDLTSALIASELQADELQLWKEVEGVFECDPRLVKNAKVLASITANEAAEMSTFGSEIIHPFTMDYVIASKVPIRVKCTFNPLSPGTLIGYEGFLSKGKIANEEKIPGKSAVSTSILKHISIFNLKAIRHISSAKFTHKVFSILDKYEIKVHMVSISSTYISVAVSGCKNDLSLLESSQLQGDTSSDDVLFDTSNNEKLSLMGKELGDISAFTIKHGFSIVSLIGSRMRQCIGAAGLMTTTLANNGINIEMISQGASEINITCLIKEEFGKKALNVIHKEILSQ